MRSTMVTARPLVPVSMLSGSNAPELAVTRQRPSGRPLFENSPVADVTTVSRAAPQAICTCALATTAPS